MADARQDLQLPESRPRRDRSLDDPRDANDQAEVALTEQRLARLIRERRGSDEGLLALLADVPPVQRLMARIVFIRELGGGRATGLFTQAYGTTWIALRTPQVDRPSLTGPPQLSAPARYDYARARGIADVLAAAKRHDGILDSDTVTQLLLGVDRHVSLAALSQLRVLPADDSGASLRERLDGLTSGGISKAVNALLRQSTVHANHCSMPRAGALLAAAERRGATLYRREAASHAEADPDHPAVEEALRRRGGGSPLPTEIRREMEERFQIDLGRVRVHWDDVAHRAATAVVAKAFTVGEDIFLSGHTFDAVSESGRTLLVHELTHVVQAYEGRLAPMQGERRSVSDPNDALEREATHQARVTRSVRKGEIAPAPGGQVVAGVLMRDYDNDYSGAFGWLHEEVFEPAQRDYSAWMATDWQVMQRNDFTSVLLKSFNIPQAHMALMGFNKTVVGIAQFAIPKTREEDFLTIMTFDLGTVYSHGEVALESGVNRATPYVKKGLSKAGKWSKAGYEWLGGNVRYGRYYLGQLFKRRPDIEKKIVSLNLQKKVEAELDRIAPTVIKPVTVKLKGALNADAIEKGFKALAGKAKSLTRAEVTSELEKLGLKKSGSPDGRFLHFRDLSGKMRARIDPPDKITNYYHLHLFTTAGEALDANLNVVAANLAASHIEIRP